ncbi:MAG: RNA polymerase sigma factor [Flavobacteriales bacterium]
MRVNSMTDRQLVAIYVQKQNEKAFEELLNRHKGRVFGKVMLMVKNRTVAEDIFQDAFMRAIHSLKAGHYYEDGKFGAWVMRIANNLCMDHFRLNKRMPMTRAKENYNPFDYISSGDQNKEEMQRNKEILGDTKKLLAFLPSEQREVVMMRLYYDMSFKEISERMDISINTALGRMRYALINLRKLIETNQMEMSLS